MIPGKVLYPGCGHTPIPEWWAGCEETRLDIDAGCKPDIVASITDMGDIGEFDYVFTSHTLEHLHDYELPKALAEFIRVLKTGGSAIIFVPDVEDVKCDRETLYVSEAGPICGFDLFYGLSGYVELNPFYAHHNAFMQSTLEKALVDAGFSKVTVKRVGCYNLMAVATK